MRDDTPSRTAAWVAFARQAGRLLPVDQRLADDPFGAAFTSPLLARWLESRAAKLGGGPLARIPGVDRWILYMQVRTRVIDDAVREFAARGGRQVVLLGAGFDCRALRLPALAGARVFEVDHPATQRHKRATLEKLGAASPATYVTWDFEARPMAELPAALTAAGHDPTAPTLTIWEGVTMYLTEPAIDASLRAIAAYSAADSRLVMTYFARLRLAEPALSTRAMAAVVARLGEPWRFGWEPAALPGFLHARGLDLVEDVALAEAARRLLPPEAAKLVSDVGRRVATVAPESIAIAVRSP